LFGKRPEVRPIVSPQFHTARSVATYLRIVTSPTPSFFRGFARAVTYSWSFAVVSYGNFRSAPRCRTQWLRCMRLV
jgi:hypothetical protein